MNAAKILKSAATIIASSGAGAVVSNAVAATTPEDLTLAKRISVFVGSVAISGMVAAAASSYTATQIDAVGESIRSLRNTVRKNND